MRIRSIKPEFWDSESMGKVSREARLLFIGLWSLSDDSGRTRASSRFLASRLFPYDEDSRGLVEGWLNELSSVGAIRGYCIDGQTYIDIPKWLNHQKIDRPSKSQIPEFDEPSRVFDEPSRALAKCSSGMGMGMGNGLNYIPPNPKFDEPSRVFDEPSRALDPKPAGTAASGACQTPDPDDLEFPYDPPSDPVPSIHPSPPVKLKPDPLEKYQVLNMHWQEIVDLIRAAHPQAKTIPPAGTKHWFEWRQSLADLVRLDKYQEEDIYQCLRWLFLDEEPDRSGFSWRAQVHSIPPLRQRKSANEPTKFTRIYEKWNQSEEPSGIYRNNRARPPASEIPGAC